MYNYFDIKSKLKSKLIDYANKSHKHPTSLKPVELCIKERARELESTLLEHSEKITRAFEKLRAVYLKMKPEYSIAFLEPNFIEGARVAIERYPPQIENESLSLSECLGIHPEDLMQAIRFVTEDLSEAEQGAKVDYLYLLAHLAGDNADLWRQYGQVVQGTGDFSAAINAYKLAYLIDPTEVVCLLDAAFASYEAGDISAAEEMLTGFDQAVKGVEGIDDLLEIAQEVRELVFDAK